jgi:hypothetical protein
MKKRFQFLLSVTLFLCLGYVSTAQHNSKFPEFKVPDWEPGRWKELPENPLIDPVTFGLPELVIGDPQILTPGEHDHQWHAFYHGFSHDDKGWHTWFFHSVSPDGLNWTEAFREEGEVGLQYIFSDGKQWIQYYAATTKATGIKEWMKKYGTIIRARTTKDFKTWSEPVDLIFPDLPLEREGSGVEARNPCVIKLPNGKYRMYYSAGMVHLEDAGYGEPKYIFCAEADNPLGPFIKREKPVLMPDKNLPFRNYGCGGFKAFGYKDGYIAFYNPIYIDENNQSRSEIRMLYSQDGLDWKEADFNPIVKPEPSIPWRSAIIYQLDVVPWKGSLLMYFNAREGWRGGEERIGALKMDLKGETPLRKLRDPIKKK